MVVQSDGNCKESCATDSSVRYGYIRIRCDHRSEVIHDAINVVVVNLARGVGVKVKGRVEKQEMSTKRERKPGTY